MSKSPSRPNSVTELAKSLSLSVGTVSQAINGHPAVAARTRERVMKAALKAGYVANRQAVALRKQKTRVIGVLVPTLRNPIYIERVASIQEIALENGYDISFGTSEWQPEQESACARQFIGMAVDGLIIDGHLTTANDANPSAFQPLINRGIPVLQIAHGDRGILAGVNRINMDVTAGIQEAFEHLLGFGHVHIGLVGIHNEPSMVHVSQRRGIELAASQTNQNVQVEYLGCDAVSEKSAYEAVTERLGQPGPFPTAIQAVSDHIVPGILKALHDHGLSVPEDVSVVGFDNLTASAYYYPSLTTVSQTHLNLGRMAVDTVIDRIDSAGEPQIIDLKLKLVVRRSTGPSTDNR